MIGFFAGCGSDGETAQHPPNRLRLNDSTLQLSRLGPRIRKPDSDLIEAAVCETVGEIKRVAMDHPDVRH